MSMIQALGNVSKVRRALIFVEDPEGNSLRFSESAFTKPAADPQWLPS